MTLPSFKKNNKNTVNFWEDWRAQNMSSVVKINPNEKDEKPTWKKVMKWVKFVIYFLMVFFALWGCVQQFAEESVVTARAVGAGFEMVENGTKSFSSHAINDGAAQLDLLGGSEINYFRVSNFDDAWFYGPFYALFVFPLGQLTIMMEKAFSGLPNSSGSLLAIFFLVALIRGSSLVLNLKSYKSQEAMRELQDKIGEINAKYAGRDDKAAKQKKQMETMSLQKSIGASPFAAFSTFMLTSPFFYSMYRVISSARTIKSTIIGPFQFVTTPLQAIQEGSWEYLLIILMVIPIQALSFTLPRILAMSKENERKKRLAKINSERSKKGGAGKFAQKMPAIMVVVFSLFSIGLPVGVAFYWTFSAGFSVFQNALFYYLRKRRSKRKEQGKPDLPPIHTRMKTFFALMSNKKSA